MKNALFIFIFLSGYSFSQMDKTVKYLGLCDEALQLYYAKNFKASGLKYSEAFKFGSRVADRYNAACTWAMAQNADSAFSQLNRIASKYDNYGQISRDPDLEPIRNDIRWKPLLEIIKQNFDKKYEKYNKPLAYRLDSIYNDDQEERLKSEAIAEKYGWDSKEIADLWRIIQYKDSVNLVKVKDILDKHGWLGADSVGEDGNAALFLVIQHSDQKTQEKYLPLMREAVKNKKANASELALLEDRVALGQGKKQIYGSQVGMDNQTKIYYVLPLEDPDNVDLRRKKVGLGPISDYVSQWGIKWNAAQYKKDLPAIEAKQKQNK
jgi:hypothetical protein